MANLLCLDSADPEIGGIRLLQIVFGKYLPMYRVIHKSVKHFKNSQQIKYSTDHGSSYADRERNSPSFFFKYIFHRCSMCPPLVIRQTSMRWSISFHKRVSISRSTRATAAVIRLRRSWRLARSGGTKTVSFTDPPIRKSSTGLNPGTGVATALTRHHLVLCVFQNTKWLLTFPERHICYYCLLAANQGNIVHGLFLKKKNLNSFSLYRRKNYHDPLRSLCVANV